MTYRKRKRCNTNLESDHHCNGAVKSNISPPKKRRTIKAVNSRRSVGVTAVGTTSKSTDEVTSAIHHRSGDLRQQQDSRDPVENTRGGRVVTTPSRRSRRVASMKGPAAAGALNMRSGDAINGIKYSARRIKGTGRNEKALSINRKNNNRSGACRPPLPPPPPPPPRLPPRQGLPSKVKTSTETPEIVSVISTNFSPSEEEDTTIRTKNSKPMERKRKRSTMCVQFGLFCTYAIFLVILLYTLWCKHLQEMNKLSYDLHTKINHKKIKLNEVQTVHSKTQEELQLAMSQLEMSLSNEKQCNESNAVIERKFDELRHHSTELANDLDKAKKRLSMIDESDEELKFSLNQAWEQIDSLLKEKNHLTELSMTCEKTLELLRNEKDDVESRIVDLELALVDLENNTQNMKLAHESEVLLRKNAEGELTQRKEKINELEDQLDKEDGRAWYYQLQMQHLEGILDDQEDWIQELVREKESLKRSLDSQLNEAVYALNAVASSATLRKAEQFQAIRKATAIEKDALVQEAAGAVQAVISVVRKTKEVKPNETVPRSDI